MKSLRSKFLFFGLFLVIALAALVISCEKEPPLPSEVTQNHQTSKVTLRHYLLPKGFGEKTLESQASIIEGLNSSDEKKFEKNLVIALYLKKIGKYDAINNKLKNGQTFLTPSLKQYLSASEITELARFSKNSLQIEETIKSRGACTPWWHYYYWNSNGPNCLNPATMWCCEWKGRWRSCWDFNGSYVQREHKYWNTCW
ncbi:hypothetical protein [Aureispira anguillae]|uniref:Lipoprotein n=1 Tax=Aureispira anguillae TaxID=2864201 RepID=A0A915YJP4_9BACT|nr:hypothetical protein [Aureispira anguillae]BDS14444.1 hypothetical protein AsAng_0052240 [Aureispira anguillae]